MYKVVLVTVFAVLVNGSLAKVVPNFINVCPGHKPECLKKSVQEAVPFFTKGIPELGIRATDPLVEDQVDLELPGGFQVHLRNGTLTGLRKCIVDDVKFTNNEADLVLRCNSTIRGQYSANGQILIVSINGNGDAKIKSTNMKLFIHINFHDVVRDGVTYSEIKDYKIKQKYGDKVTFVLTNLFKGNPELSQAVLQFLNANWEQIVEEFGGPIFNRLADQIVQSVRTFFEKVPKNELGF